MKLSTTVAVLLCTASTYASAGNPDFCQTSASTFANWVASSQGLMDNNESRLQQVQLEISRGNSYAGVANRMAARANTLLDKTTLSKSEIKADLYGLCMSLT